MAAAARGPAAGPLSVAAAKGASELEPLVGLRTVPGIGMWIPGAGIGNTGGATTGTGTTGAAGSGHGQLSRRHRVQRPRRSDRRRQTDLRPRGGRLD